MNQPNNFKGSKESEILKNLQSAKDEVPISHARQQVRKFTRAFVLLLGEVLLLFLLWNWQISPLLKTKITFLQAASIIILIKVLFPIGSMTATILESVKPAKTEPINNKK